MGRINSAGIRRESATTPGDWGNLATRDESLALLKALGECDDRRLGITPQ
jgi:hypothetical protein